MLANQPVDAAGAGAATLLPPTARLEPPPLSVDCAVWCA